MSLTLIIQKYLFNNYLFIIYLIIYLIILFSNTHFPYILLTNITYFLIHTQATHTCTYTFLSHMSTFRTKARLAGAMDTLVGNAMIYKHLVIPHWDDWRIHQNIIYTKMERNMINTKLWHSSHRGSS